VFLLSAAAAAAVKKIHDRCTTRCDPSDRTNSNRCRKKRRVGEDRIRIRDTLWARPAWGHRPLSGRFSHRLSRRPPADHTRTAAFTPAAVAICLARFGCGLCLLAVDATRLRRQRRGDVCGYPPPVEKPYLPGAYSCATIVIATDRADVSHWLVNRDAPGLLPSLTLDGGALFNRRNTVAASTSASASQSCDPRTSVPVAFRTRPCSPP
jgi:hypothetical protein